MTFLDVGQGDCVCLELPDGETWLFDGGSLNVSGVGSYRIVPYLKSRGISTLEAVFLSHSDSDHINGVTEILKKGGVDIELLALPYTEAAPAWNTDSAFGEIILLAEKKQIPIVRLYEGMKWERAGVKGECLHPARGFDAENSNEASEALYLSYGDFSLLLAGDIEGEGEKALTKSLAERNKERVTVLKVAHHGSKGSTGERFLEQLSPDIAVISCGKDNSYGHPHEELLGRLIEAGCKIYMTREEGAVMFHTDGQVLKRY